MTLEDKGKVGSRGELLPSKKIREAMGLKKGHCVKFSVINGRLIVERIPDPSELLSRPTKVILTSEDLKKERQQLSKELEG
jgi:bifunctional DNA-binding transcriptional regulator/antitoxin component of YhaV-PrlF toxin-antitoxin module